MLQLTPERKIQLMRQAEISPGVAILTILGLLEKQAEVMVNQKLTAMESTLPEKVVLKHVEKLKGEKGDPGKDGIDGKVINAEDVVDYIYSRIRIPEDGKSPTREELIALIIPLMPTQTDIENTIRPLLPKPELLDEDKLKELVLSLIPEDDDSQDEEMAKKVESLEKEIQLLKILPLGGVGKKGRYLHGGGGSDVQASNFIDNEIISGSGTAFALAFTPASGSVKIFAGHNRLYPTTDYTISGKNITTVLTWVAGDLIADYRTKTT